MLISPSFRFPQEHPPPAGPCILSYRSARSTHAPRAAAPRLGSGQRPAEPSQPSSRQARGRADADVPAALQEPLPLSGTAVTEITESQNGLEGTSGGHPAQPPCRSRVTQSRQTASRRVWNISREGDSTASLGSLCQGSVTLRGKKFLKPSCLLLPDHRWAIVSHQPAPAVKDSDYLLIAERFLQLEFLREEHPAPRCTPRLAAPRASLHPSPLACSGCQRHTDALRERQAGNPSLLPGWMCPCP